MKTHHIVPISDVIDHNIESRFSCLCEPEIYKTGDNVLVLHGHVDGNARVEDDLRRMAGEILTRGLGAAAADAGWRVSGKTVSSDGRIRPRRPLS